MLMRLMEKFKKMHEYIGHFIGKTETKRKN